MRISIAHRLILLAVLLSLGIGGLFAHAIWTMHQNQWHFATRNNVNLAHTLSQAIATTVEAFDHSLQGVVDGLGDAQTMALAPALRQRVLFDYSLEMHGIEGIWVLDAQGRVVLESGPNATAATQLHPWPYTESLQAFQQGSHTGLHVGQPVRSPTTGQYVLPLSRAYYHADGRLAGVVVGALRVAYFNKLFASAQLGLQSGINLLRADGIVVARFPYGDEDVGKSLAGTANMRTLQSAPSGTFNSFVVLDGVERMYAFQHINNYPLVVNVARAVDAVMADWRHSAALLGVFALVLMAACMGLAVLFARELQRRQHVSAQLQQTQHDLQTILDNLPSMVSYWDRELCNRFANRVSDAWFGISPEEMRGMPAADMLGAEDFALVLPYLQKALQGQKQLFERTLISPDGQVRHTYVSYTPDLDGQTGQVRGIFAQITDITERKRMEDELFREKERMRLTLQSIGDAVVCTDAEGRISYLNPVAERMTGWQAFDAAGRDIDTVAPLYLTNGAQTQPSPLRLALQARIACGPTRGVVLHRKDGRRFQVEESASPIIDRHGQLTGAVMVLHDVTDTMAMAERMAHLAQYDALTDLPNRVLLQDRARHALAQAQRDGKILAVLYLDLDGFKQVNDQLGHDVGDQLLVEFARRLRAAVRQSDTVCRQGGDEFVVLLPGLLNTHQVSVVADKILATCVPDFVLSAHTVRVGVSGGIALFPQHGKDFEALSCHADAAMYAAKRGGRGHFRLYAIDGAEHQRVAPASL